MGKTAFMGIDMINNCEHPDAELLISSAERAVPRIVRFIEAAQQRNVPVIYAHDNFGQWRSHHGEIVETALAGARGDLVEPLRPDETSLFVVKARHSIFYETPLAYLLSQLNVDHIVLCGQVTEHRHLGVTIPNDAVAHIHSDLADAALCMIQRNMNAVIRPGDTIEL
ncbi:cysteine hydrolase family protein [Streptomyces sp. NPDC058394]|uniref:cysteine hydrolase family protein n=1 Tax=unclassified Streptomyces TaxID=2593676 RepID=UPI003662AB74